MKESSEQHLVIKTYLQNTMNPLLKQPKTSQNSKGPPNKNQPMKAQQTQSQTQASSSSPPSKSRSRRRGRDGRKSNQTKVCCMRPCSRHCTTLSHTTTNRAVSLNLIEVDREETNNGIGEMDVGFPTSSKALSFAQRPGFGQLGTKCVVKANHFFTELPDKDLNQYDVSYIFYYYLLS